CGHDEAAFAVLVERYGGLVLGVCRRLLGNGHDAEDAFQATFLVLARRTARLDRSGPLGGWLHTVAYRLALRARTEQAQRCHRERKVAKEVTGRAAEESNIEEWRPLLDEELQRLPEKYRLPLLLCYLQGKTNAEAAAALGWPAGSMSRRLARARELLREGLVRRGVGLPAALLGVAAAGELEAAVPASLLAVTARAAVAFAGCQVAVEVSAGARVLAQAYLKGMAMTKIKVLAAVILLAGLVTGGTLAQRADNGDKKDDRPPAEQASKKLHDDGSFSRFYVHVEVRGTLAKTDAAATVTALQKVYAVSHPNKALPEFSPTQTWKLDLTRGKGLRQTVKDLDGKTVHVTGWGELRQLVQPSTPGAGSSLGRGPLQPPSPYWVVHDTIVVTDLRLAEKE
ncbi:MAG TPA: sigma-70 family RNA polymerase sigma factor, partial [Gemmataceae bacterium]|nr:sigma-70 family RNA polymerase sigma factor [Gemmataceae bacterium]